MPALPGRITVPAMGTLLEDGSLTGDWVLDQATSSVRLKSRSIWGLAAVNGVFRDVSGNSTVSPQGEVRGTVTVAAASVDTGNARRDRHLRSADFFDSASYPDIIFTADGIRPAGQGVAVTGALTVRGRTRPLSFDAVASAHGGGIWLDTQVHINRADFALTWNQRGMASMHSTLTIHAVFTRP